VTVGGVLISVGTAFIAEGYSNIMNYVQTLFSIFNAPLSRRPSWRCSLAAGDGVGRLLEPGGREVNADPRAGLWWRSPALLGGVALVLVLVLNIIFI
jgi:hypothetical protein